LVHGAFCHCGHRRKILLSHFDELVTVPGLTQNELKRFDAQTEGSREPYLGKYHMVHSSGSTGKPGYFLYDKRALYGANGILVKDCRFDGPANGESAFKDGNRIGVERCFFNLHYPFWHDTD